MGLLLFLIAVVTGPAFAMSLGMGLGLSMALDGSGGNSPAEGSGAASLMTEATGAGAHGGFEAEDQTPSGKFTTAGEVRMILEATKPQWIAVRAYEGQDLLYFTNLLAWRCGVHQIRYSVNGDPFEVLASEPCYPDEAAPNALKMTDGMLPYVARPLDTIRTIDIEVLFDDLTTERAHYERPSVEID